MFVLCGIIFRFRQGSKGFLGLIVLSFVVGSVFDLIFGTFRSW